MSKVQGGSQYEVYGKTHYERNKERYIEAAKRRRRRNAEYIRDIKKLSECTDCGEGDWIVLEFDHLGDKEYNIADMVPPKE